MSGGSDADSRKNDTQLHKYACHEGILRPKEPQGENMKKRKVFLSIATALLWFLHCDTNRLGISPKWGEEGTAPPFLPCSRSTGYSSIS